MALGSIASVATLLVGGQLLWQRNPWGSLLVVAAALEVLALLWFRRTVSRTERDLEAREAALRQERTALDTEITTLQAARTSAEQELNAQSQRLLAQQQAHSRRLATFHEWQEFPAPLDLSLPTATVEEGSQLAELLRRDQQLQELLQRETEALFDRIRRNVYMVEGKFQLPRLRDDLLALMLSCARVYQPEVEQPLLETSLERVLRALSRLALQWLVVLENLPLDVQSRNLSSLYGYLRQATQAYQTWKLVRPYWTYANHAWYLGRLALGANPITLGAWWVLGRLGTHSAQTLAERFLHQQALTLLADMVRVVGYEMADLYGGDFRHRDPNWIFAAELTELLSRFPLSRESLREALRQLSLLALRSEYDRSYLLRCLALGKSALPGRSATALMLSVAERRLIAARLEKFLVRHVHGRTPGRLAEWSSAVETRLGVKVRVGNEPYPLDTQMQLVSAVRSLAGYLTAMKQLSGDQLQPALERGECWSLLEAGRRDELAAQLAHQPPFFFDEPDLDPQGPVAAHFISDLLRAAAAYAPRSRFSGAAVQDVAQYLGLPVDKIPARWLAELHNVAQRQCERKGDVRGLDAELLALVLDLLEGKSLQWLYRGVVVEPELPATSSGQSYVLFGTRERIMLCGVVDGSPRVPWQATSRVTGELVRGLMTRDCLIRGGQWLAADEEPRRLRVAGPVLQSSESYFQPLLNWSGAS
jgi:hypothetical protein